MSDAGRVAFFTAIFILGSLLLQFHHARRTELITEALCWALLAAVIPLARRLHVLPKKISDNNAPNHWKSLWIVASCVATSSLCTAEAEVAWILPALVPLLMIYLAYRSPPSDLSGRRHSALLEAFSNRTAKASLFAVIVAICSFAVLARYSGIYAAVALLATFLTIAIFHDLSKDEDAAMSAMRMEDILENLSWKIVTITFGALLIQNMVFGSVEIGFIPIAARALLKLSSWMCLSQMIPSTPWTIVPSVWTFLALTGIGSAIPGTPLHALLLVVASVFTLSHVVYLLPQSAKFRSLLWTAGLFPVIIFLAREAMVFQATAAYASYSISGVEHPIEHLAREADSRFARMREAQSKTYNEAHEEYVRRYAIPPPPGFNQWFKFATTQESPIIDDFDMIHQMLQPFLKFSGKEIADLMQRALETQENDIWHCALGSNMPASECNNIHRVKSDDRHYSRAFNRLLAYKNVSIPSINLLVNHLDEPAVLIPLDLTKTISIMWTKIYHQPVWDRLTKHCHYPKSTSQSPTLKKTDAPMDFIHNASSSRDLCQNPSYKNYHAFFISPNSFRLIEAPIPILSTGTFSTMGDIIFPSPAYTESQFLYDEAFDKNWESKRNEIHWAGSATGGYAENGNWRNFQRQRLASLGQDLETREHRYLRVEDGVVKATNSTFLNTRLWDISLTLFNQCAKEACSDENAYFYKRDRIDGNRGFQSTLVMDLDGNGISGRFYKFLASKSCPLKQTLFREWHDERLVPWVHYVPVGMNMEELPELVSYLTLSKIGQKRARDIAERGREWYGTALRVVDMDIYLYRLLLEMARLQDPAREAGGY